MNSFDLHLRLDALSSLLGRIQEVEDNLSLALESIMLVVPCLADLDASS